MTEKIGNIIFGYGKVIEAEVTVTEKESING